MRRAGRVRDDAGPAPGRRLGDVAGKADRRGNPFPAKARENRIDAAVALMVVVGRAMAEDTNGGDLMDFLRNPVIA